MHDQFMTSSSFSVVIFVGGNFTFMVRSLKLKATKLSAPWAGLWIHFQLDHFLVPTTTTPTPPSMFCVKFHYQSRKNFINKLYTVGVKTGSLQSPKGIHVYLEMIHIYYCIMKVKLR